MQLLQEEEANRGVAAMSPARQRLFTWLLVSAAIALVVAGLVALWYWRDEIGR